MKRTSFVAIAFSVVFSGCVSSASRPDYPTDLLTITVDVGRNDDGKLIDSILESATRSPDWKNKEVATSGRTYRCCE